MITSVICSTLTVPPPRVTRSRDSALSFKVPFWASPLFSHLKGSASPPPHRTSARSSRTHRVTFGHRPDRAALSLPDFGDGTHLVAADGALRRAHAPPAGLLGARYGAHRKVRRATGAHALVPTWQE